jgi:hypothetical protein
VDGDRAATVRFSQGSLLHLSILRSFVLSLFPPTPSSRNRNSPQTDTFRVFAFPAGESFPVFFGGLCDWFLKLDHRDVEMSISTDVGVPFSLQSCTHVPIIPPTKPPIHPTPSMRRFPGLCRDDIWILPRGKLSILPFNAHRPEVTRCDHHEPPIYKLQQYSQVCRTWEKSRLKGEHIGSTRSQFF